MPETAVHDQIVALAQEAGFSKAGIAPIPQPGQPELTEFRNLLRELDRARVCGRDGVPEASRPRTTACCDPHCGLPSRGPDPWIVCAANYNADAPRSTDPTSPESAWIARYAWTGYQSESSQGPSPPSDYHDVLLARLKKLEQRLQQALGPFPSRCYVDTGPLVERVYALHAGIGWIGKKHLHPRPAAGFVALFGRDSYRLELPSARPVTLPEDRCGSCTRCIDACPTGALIAPYQMDASLCISYLDD